MWRLDHVDTNVWESLNENRANFDDLEVKEDEVQVVVGCLLDGVDLETETEWLLNDLWLSMVSRSEFVVARQNPRVVTIVFLLTLHMFVMVFVVLVVLSLVGDLWSDE